MEFKNLILTLGIVLLASILFLPMGSKSLGILLAVIGFILIIIHFKK
jgi:O-antigen ligase